MINKEKIIMIGDAPRDSSIDALKVFKESGIDTYVIYPDEKDHYGAIERCEKVGLDTFIFGGSVAFEGNKHFFPYAIENFPNFIERYNKEMVDLNKYKGLTGLYMIDEPFHNFFQYISEYYVPWFNEKYAGKKLWHVNMLPSYSPAFEGEWSECSAKFENYISAYTESVLSKVKGTKTLGVDHYPMRAKKGVITLSDEFLYDLAVVGENARKANAIYSVCIQAYCDVDQKKVDCTGDIRFQIYTAMAFGASMFEFYAYSTLHGTLAMLDNDDKPTDIYYSVRDAIREIRAFEKEYLNYDWKGVKYYLPENGTCKAFDKIEKFQSENLQGIKDVKVSRQTLVSEFDNNGKKAYMVVNYGMPILSNSDIVELTFDKAEKITVYQNGRKDQMEISDNKISLFLEAGQGVFVVVNE